MLECAVRTESRRPGVVNEDSCLIMPTLGLFAVADGLGGHEGGWLASRIAMETLRDSVRGNVSKRAILRAIYAAHENIRILSQRECRPAATIAATWVQTDEIHCFHVGDSRIYRFRDFRLEQLTNDHSIDTCDLGKHGEYGLSSHRISQALGMLGEPVVATTVRRWCAGDQLLLVTDGITDFVSNLHISNLWENSVTPSQTLDQLVDFSRGRGSRDDRTAILVYESSK